MELTAQEIEWVLYSVNKTINDNGGMWDNTLTDSIKLKLNNELLLKTETLQERADRTNPYLLKTGDN
jgi:hypothetical protein